MSINHSRRPNAPVWRSTTVWLIVIISIIIISFTWFTVENKITTSNGMTAQFVQSRPCTADALGNSNQSGDEWPMFRGGLNHTGMVTTTPLKGTGPTWSFTTGNYVASSPSVAGGRVYVGSAGYKVYCLDANTGKRLWSYTTGGSVQSSPAIASGYVYVGSDKVYCLNATTGSLKWNYTTIGWVDSSPSIAEGRVYVGGYKLYCLNATTGSLKWNYTTIGWVESSPAVANGRVYVGSNDGKVYCLNAITGAFNWSRTTGNVVESSPAVENGRVYVGSNDGKVYCLNAITGASIWNYTTSNSVYSSPAVLNDRVYVGSEDNKTYCLNATTGMFVWSYTTGGPVYSSPSLAGGRVYVGSCYRDTKLYCLDATTGTLVWSYTTYGEVFSSPAVVGGRVYVGSDDDRIYCLPMLFISSITHPLNITYGWGVTSNEISWIITSLNSGTARYTVYRNGEAIGEGSWTSGPPVQWNIDGLAIGTYNYTIIATDGFGSSVQDTVIVTVQVSDNFVVIIVLLAIFALFAIIGMILAWKLQESILPLLSRHNIVECNATKLVTEFSNQSPLTADEKLKRRKSRLFPLIVAIAMAIMVLLFAVTIIVAYGLTNPMDYVALVIIPSFIGIGVYFFILSNKCDKYRRIEVDTSNRIASATIMSAAGKEKHDIFSFDRILHVTLFSNPKSGVKAANIVFKPEKSLMARSKKNAACQLYFDPAIDGSPFYSTENIELYLQELFPRVEVVVFGHERGKRKIATGVLLILIGVASLMVITFGYLSIMFSMQYYSDAYEELFIVLANGIGVFFITMGVGLIQRRYKTSYEEHKAIRKNIFLGIVLLFLLVFSSWFLVSLF